MGTKRPAAPTRKPSSRKQQLLKLLVRFFVWMGAAVLYYIGFSIFFDTPVEYELKHDIDLLQREYSALSGRYDTLMLVLENLEERDRAVFRSLFEADPYDSDAAYADRREATYEAIINRSTRTLNRMLQERVEGLDRSLDELNASYAQLQAGIEHVGDGTDGIPAIQPVINKQLSLLTTSYGMRIHPFYKTLYSHQGVDYAIPEGSRIFATADGKVREVSSTSTSGRTVVIDHGNGYETSYSHLSQISVRKGQQVHRGDIIALSGDTGLSLAPHLHYEVRLNGMRVDPIHYFFMELSPTEYRRLMQIAQSGMQAFD